MEVHKEIDIDLQQSAGHHALVSDQLSKSEQASVINRLLLIHQLSLTLQTQLDQERLLRIMLSGITAGESLGFNRALVFLLDEEGKCLHGKLGVGPINEEECRHVWKTIVEKGLKLDDFIHEFGQLRKYQTTCLNVQTLSIHWKIGQANDIFSRTLKEQTCFHITPSQFLDEVPPCLLSILEVEEMAIAPLVVSGRSLGLVVADNKFSGKYITEENIQLLSIVANQTATALAHIRIIGELERMQGQLEEKVREAVAEKERAQEEMIRKAKLATVGEMAVTVAHEIRNPLTAVRGFAQRLHRKYSDPERVHSYAETIIQEVDRLNSVLGDVLDFARNVDSRVRPVKINDLVERTIRLLEELFGRRQIICETDLSPDVPVCYYDETQISQVLINLMKNGAQAMKEGGVLFVRTALVEGQVYIEITDTGHGIDPKILPKIFEPFFTTKNQGTGLGLSLAKRVIEEHGGIIKVQSEISKGTTFRIVLPVQLEAPNLSEVITSLDRARPIVNPSDPLASTINRIVTV